MMRYVIGDIHGCYKTLKLLIEEKIKPSRTDKLFFLGDYIDRGPDSKAVLDFLMEMLKEGYQLTLLKGNHEDMMMEAAGSEKAFELWMTNKGDTTLRDFGITDHAQLGPKALERIPDIYTGFIREMPLLINSEPEAALVHAGLNFNANDPFRQDDLMAWTREEQYDKQLMQGRKIIHGHTPVSVEDMIERINNPQAGVINLDGGCVYNKRTHLGNLVALKLENFELLVQPNSE
ncbi:MAG: serine/threonine protein phosphatase [Bacteroidales bacterium]|nr:serine/threonine protein phosphatase [Bacteroidales bacterium]MCF8349930.1 serine/threonine protein phosphatase [Bacteroidales bacterium]MCF8375447.1 serine/threonine protein phosphatase [Bacteroidales bacterium]MCF8401349.1 serine/threonine protein phosphatase [Bacteroidales bacterium]